MPPGDDESDEIGPGSPFIQVLVHDTHKHRPRQLVVPGLVSLRSHVVHLEGTLRGAKEGRRRRRRGSSSSSSSSSSSMRRRMDKRLRAVGCQGKRSSG
eukprot:417347-Hanusia_phi.AAC.1